jgi:hypothetical protein
VGFAGATEEAVLVEEEEGKDWDGGGAWFEFGVGGEGGTDEEALVLDPIAAAWNAGKSLPGFTANTMPYLQ